jgi:hypothetical protein
VSASSDGATRKQVNAAEARQEELERMLTGTNEKLCAQITRLMDADEIESMRQEPPPHTFPLVPSGIG